MGQAPKHMAALTYLHDIGVGVLHPDNFDILETVFSSCGTPFLFLGQRSKGK